MDWKQATLAQLYEIAYNDPEATLQHKLDAGAEIKRGQGPGESLKGSTTRKRRYTPGERANRR